jgi:non-ribosomal peptide synthetase component F
MSGDMVRVPQPLARLWKQAAARFAAMPALSVPGGGLLTFAEVDERAGEVATALRSCGAGPGTGVIVGIDRGYSVPVALLGTWLAGAAAIPAQSPDDAARLAPAAGGRLLITAGSSLRGNVTECQIGSPREPWRL